MRKPKVYVLTTGGTIASYSNERGAAVLGFRPEGLLPDLGLPDVEIEVKSVLQKGSMNIIPEDWKLIAEATAEVLRTKPQGVVILHGTDTMHYTAAALSFMIGNLNAPVVLTGSMIPGGDKGSDSLPNFRDAITVAAYADLGEVCIVFSGDPERKKGVILRGCRAKKVHSYAIHAFASINVPPLGYVEEGNIQYTDLKRYPRKDSPFKVSTNFNPHVVLVKLTPAITRQSLTRFLERASGAVLEGTGIGHIRTDLQEVIAAFKRPTAMSTQTIYGGERLGLYDTDQSILKIENIIPTRDMNSETALVKLMYALGQGDDVKSMMLTNLAGEMSE